MGYVFLQGTYRLELIDIDSCVCPRDFKWIVQRRNGVAMIFDSYHWRKELSLMMDELVSCFRFFIFASNEFPVCAAIAINLGYYTYSDAVVVDSK